MGRMCSLEVSAGMLSLSAELRHCRARLAGPGDKARLQAIWTHHAGRPKGVRVVNLLFFTTMAARRGLQIGLRDAISIEPG
jgi:hypothetical protein